MQETKKEPMNNEFMLEPKKELMSKELNQETKKEPIIMDSC